MASEWAYVIARDQLRDVESMATNLDAARIQGLEEAAEIAKAHIDGCQLPPQGSERRKEYTRGAYDTASKIVGEIRDRIKEKAGKG